MTKRKIVKCKKHIWEKDGRYQLITQVHLDNPSKYFFLECWKCPHTINVTGKNLQLAYPMPIIPFRLKKFTDDVTGA